MAYPSLSAGPHDADIRDFFLDVASRKEFRSLMPGDEKPVGQFAHPYGLGLPGAPAAPLVADIPGLRLHGAQLFVAGFASPNTPYTRLLMNWQTGTGKTIGAIAVAQEFVQSFRRQVGVPPADRPTVFVVGFTRALFQAELLRRPEFGIVSPAEAAELRRLAALGNSEAESRQLAALSASLKRRITDRSRGGYYRFYGYKEFANRLFVITQRGMARGFSTAAMYAGADTAEGDEAEDRDPSAESPFLARVEAAIAAGDVEVSQDLLSELRGGLLIADEIHNTYNLQAKNSYGVAIEYALDNLGDAAPRAIFASATATGGGAAEVVELLNFLVPPSQRGGRRFLRSEFFEASPDGRARMSLIPGAGQRIGRLSAGRVSFLLDSDEGNYPRRVFEGVPLPAPGADKNIAYLRFVPCPASPLHARALARVEDASSRSVMPANASALYDMVYPSPDGGEGLYLSTDTIPRIVVAPPDWRQAVGITVESSEGSGRGPARLGGAFLSLAPAQGEPPGVATYSSKYQALGEDILRVLRTGPGKILVYHQRVQLSGCLQIISLLEANGFVDEHAPPVASTRCAVCGVARRSHGEKNDSWAGAHAYAPARYASVNSSRDASSNAHSLAAFNAAGNAKGFSIRVLVGSKLIREGYDFRAVRHLFVASLPTDIPTLLQVIGRAVRKGSHADLPQEERDVRVRIYVTTLQPGKFSPEHVRWAEKMDAYFLTQEVEKEIRRYAVDSFINFQRIRPALSAPSIDGVPYEPVVSPAEAAEMAQKTSTFYAYGYGSREVETLKSAVRALFTVQPVWTYEDLWAAIRAGRVSGLAENPASFDEESFALALDGLGLHLPGVMREAVADVGGEAWMVARVGKYYVRAAAGPGGRPHIDIESYIRGSAAPAKLRYRVADFARSEERAGRRLESRLAEFDRLFSSESLPIEDMLTLYDADFHFALLAQIVEGKQSSPARERAAALYARFKVLVRGAEAKTLTGAAGRVKAVKPDQPAGYVGTSSVRLYGRDGAWFDLPLKAMDIAPRQTENDIVVGYAETRSATVRFKIRPPLHKIAAAGATDVRSLARGAVCSTRSHAEQESIMSRLASVRGGEKFPADDGPCAYIRNRLLSLEEASRSSAHGMKSGLRWFYLFNEHPPAPALVR